MEEEDKSKYKSQNSKRCSNKIMKKSCSAPINNLDDGCLMHIFSFLSPIPDRYNTALVSHRWHYLACHPRMWLRVDRSIKDLSEPGVFPDISTAVSAARPGDTILIAAGGSHLASNIQIKKPLCLIGGGELPDETTLTCYRGSDSLEWGPRKSPQQNSVCLFVQIEQCTGVSIHLQVDELDWRAELGCCLLHRSGRLTIDGCILQCETNPLDYLSCPIVSTARSCKLITSPVKSNGDSVSVLQTQIEGGVKAVLTKGNLVLQRVRVIYARTNVYFWFDVDHQ